MKLDYAILTNAADEANLTIMWIHRSHSHMRLYRDAEYICAINFLPYENSNSEYVLSRFGDKKTLTLEEICDYIRGLG
jgi:hypothetical protein